MRNVLRSDKYALRACILYEFLKYKLAEGGNSTQHLWPRSFMALEEIQRNPSFALHSNFCKKLGEDVMDYPEFDFWFCRFVNEEFDLSYERDTDVKMLSDMPIDIIRIILQHLHIFDRISLAQTSQSFKTFVEDQKVFHRKMKFRINDLAARISSEHRFIITINSENGCRKSTERPGNDNLIQGVPYWKQGIQEFESVLKISKLHLKELCIDLYPRSEPSKEQIKVVDEVILGLKTPIEQLHVKELALSTHSMKPLLKILRSLKPVYLTIINFYPRDPDDHAMEKVVKMEQFKQAKYFYMVRTLFVGPLSHFYHFKEFQVYLKQLSVKNVRKMKEILFNSPHFKKCLIRVYDSLDLDDIGHEFGDSIRERPNIYHYPILNSNEYFRIELELWRIEISRKKK